MKLSKGKVYSIIGHDGTPSTHCTGGWVGPRYGLNRCGNPRPLPGFDPRTVQPVACRHNYYATRPMKRSNFDLI